jgi:uncharacterized protein (DUF433 family)
VTVHDRIVTDPTVCNGRPLIRGTQVPVTIVVGDLAAGKTFEEVQQEYDVAVEDIRAALKFVNELASLASEFFCSRPHSRQ